MVVFVEAAFSALDRRVLSDAAWRRMVPLIIDGPDQNASTRR
jgi:hypothetical protein